ncbi:hypothetical protein DRQ27_05985 [bacterium]|nr:MAG: hypothetical protein DRQ27_05985 [bacterium]
MVKSKQFLFFIISIAFLIYTGCASNSKVSPPPLPEQENNEEHRESRNYCDVKINITVTLPLSLYFGRYGSLHIDGPDGYFDDLRIEMLMGDQTITLRRVPEGRYTFTLTYADIVISKCAVICCYCDMDWKHRCMENLKAVLKNRMNSYYNTTYYDDCYGYNYNWNYSSPACGYPEPCSVIVSFIIPDDLYKYDP